MIRVDHGTSFAVCWECGTAGEVEIILSNQHPEIHFHLCAVHWEELVLKLQGKPVPG